MSAKCRIAIDRATIALRNGRRRLALEPDPVPEGRNRFLKAEVTRSGEILHEHTIRELYFALQQIR